MVTFATSVTLTLYGNPPVSCGPDPVWKERMWDTHTHARTQTLPAIIWLEIFLAIGTRSSAGESASPGDDGGRASGENRSRSALRARICCPRDGQRERQVRVDGEGGGRAGERILGAPPGTAGRSWKRRNKT